MTVLAIDPSTKNTGWAVYKDKKLIAYNCINAGSANLFNRIHKMESELEKIVQEYEVTHIVLEDVTLEDVYNNMKIFKVLTYLQGYILDMLDRNKKDKITFYFPSEWRAKCGIKTGPGIKRDSLKPKDIAFVLNQFGKKVNDDIADAICIGFAFVGGEIKSPQTIIDDTGFEFG